MLTYTTLQDRPREFLAATGLTHAEFAYLLPAFATAYALRSPPEKTLEGTPCRWWGHWDLATDGRYTAFDPRLSNNPSFANSAWLTIPAEPTPDPLLASSCAARLATGLSRSRAGAGACGKPGGHQPPGARGRPCSGQRRHGTPSPTAHQGCPAPGARQRQEENPYGQTPPLGERTHRPSPLSGTDRGRQQARQASRRGGGDGLSDPGHARQGHGLSGR